MIGMLTGGGGGMSTGGGHSLDLTTTQSADGDNTFSHAFSYRTGAESNINETLVIGAVLLAAVFILGGRR